MHTKRIVPGNEALLRKEGNRLVVEPVRRPSVLELVASWEPLDEDFPEIEDPPPLDDGPFAGLSLENWLEPDDEPLVCREKPKEWRKSVAS